MSWTIHEDEQVTHWLDDLNKTNPKVYALVVAAVDILAEQGPALHRPLSAPIKSSQHKTMKELRPKSTQRTAPRVLYSFLPNRECILLRGGDKAGDWTEWYVVNIALADEQLDEQIAKITKEKEAASASSKPKTTSSKSKKKRHK